MAGDRDSVGPLSPDMLHTAGGIYIYSIVRAGVGTPACVSALFPARIMRPPNRGNPPPSDQEPGSTAKSMISLSITLPSSVYCYAVAYDQHHTRRSVVVDYRGSTLQLRCYARAERALPMRTCLLIGSSLRLKNIRPRFDLTSAVSPLDDEAVDSALTVSVYDTPLL